MKIKFEPKIIVGSIFGIISTIIGTIAIFFPNLLNMEVQKIDEFACTIEDDAWPAIEKLQNFLQSKSGKKDEIFHLNIDGIVLLEGGLARPIKDSNNSKCRGELFRYNIENEDTNLEISFVHQVKVPKGNDDIFSTNFTHGEKFIFEGQQQSKFDGQYFQQCKTNAYFIFQEEYDDKNIKYVLFKKVPDDMIKSKKY